MDDIDVAREAARLGAEVVRDHFGGARVPDFKAKFDPVTEADRASERAIIDHLRSQRPSDGVLAEEGSGRAAAGRRWIVDPLDGTVNFVHGIPHVAISVALYEDDNPLLGVVIDPFRDEEFSAVVGAGAALNGAPLAVSSRASIGDAVIATGFPYDHDRYAARYARVLEEVLRRANGIRRMGSAALDLCWVAGGRYEGYWELGLAPWDMAAGLVIVREAGGTVTDPQGRQSTLALPYVVASNGHVHEELRAAVLAGLAASR